MQVQNCMERQRETNLKDTEGTVETVETGDTCKYKIKRQIQRSKETEEPVETGETRGDT